MTRWPSAGVPVATALAVALAACSATTVLVALDARAADPPSTPAIDSLDALFAALARSPGIYATFHEQKRIALLASPLESDGTIHFEKGRGLARHTLSPRRRSVLLSTESLMIWDGSKTETVPLRGSGPLRALTEAFSMMLAADRTGLERSFNVTFTTSGDGSWHLRLEPRTKDLASIVTAIDVTGRAMVVTTLRVAEASGDTSTTTFADVDTNKRYSEVEARTVFRVPPGPAP
jgi:hypothetical protein